MKIIIASYYEDEINPEHAKSIIYLTSILNEMKVRYDYFYADNRVESDKIKNEWIWDFLRTDATHLFMINPSLSWDLRGCVRFFNIVRKGAEIVAGAFPNKMGSFGVHIKTEDDIPIGMEGDKFRILDALSVVNGFIIFKREVFEKLKSNFETYIKPSQYGEPEKDITEFFKKGNFRHSEDMEFQKTIIEKGIKIFIEPNITFKCVGKRVWTGNYNQYLLGGQCIL